ncbi:MAG: dockerin type I repeat-containing protein [Oscillospiraceae bacterium]|nr:dockerin type I repeat-containing protein [Oscillospiraceae bacterium]
MKRIHKLIAAALALTMLTPMTAALPASAADAWRTEYQKLLNANKSMSTDPLMYSLADVVGDGIPELMISSEGSAHPSRVKIYTYYQGKTVLLGQEGEYGIVRFDTTTREFVGGFSNMGIINEDRFICRCGELEQTRSISFNGGAASGPIYYTINGKDVSEAEFYADQNIYATHKLEFYGRDYLTTNLTPLNNFKVTNPVATPGNLTGDSVINASDAAKILIGASNYGAKGQTGLTGAQEDAGDVNGDHKINASDAAIVLIYSAAVGAGKSGARLQDYIR